MGKHRTIPSNMIAEVSPKGSGIPSKPVVNNDGHLIVDIQNQADQEKEKTYYNEITSIPKNVETQIIAYTVPVNKIVSLKGGSATGMTDATFKLYINNELKETLHNTWTERNVKFGTIEQIENEYIIKITVEHLSDEVHDFNSSIFLTLR